MKRLIITLSLGILMSFDQIMEIFTQIDNVLLITRMVAVIALILFLAFQIVWYIGDKKKDIKNKKVKNLIRDFKRFKSEVYHSTPTFQFYIRKYFSDKEILKLIELNKLKFSELDSKSEYEMGGIEKYSFIRS